MQNRLIETISAGQGPSGSGLAEAAGTAERAAEAEPGSGVEAGADDAGAVCLAGGRSWAPAARSSRHDEHAARRARAEQSDRDDIKPKG